MRTTPGTGRRTAAFKKSRPKWNRATYALVSRGRPIFAGTGGGDVAAHDSAAGVGPHFLSLEE